MPARSIKGVGEMENFGKSKHHTFKKLDLNEVLTPSSDAGAFTSTKLICALGPSSHSEAVLSQMLANGMVGARIDLVWGGVDFHRESLRALNEACAVTKKLCAVVVDTLGREVMVRRPCVIGDDGWPEHADPLTVEAGQAVTLTTREDAEASTGDATEGLLLPVTYPQLHAMCEPGDTIYIGRYLVCGSDSASLYLEVKAVDGQDIVCEAKNGAVMDGLMTVFHMERSSDSLLNLQNTLPLLSDYDKAAIAALGSEFEIDYISLAYTRTREDIRECRAFLDSIGLTHTRILAKVETRQALLNYRGILAAADGVIVSRGNIGLDVAPEKMALVQKQLIQQCNLLGKPVLITRVVDSMVTSPRPTRAEATDIANAVLDGTDGIFLGAETLRGGYPVESVATIAQICRVAEAVFDYSSHYDHLMDAAQEMEASVKHAARLAAASGDGALPGNGHAAAAAGKAVAFAAHQGSASDEVDDSDGLSDAPGDGEAGYGAQQQQQPLVAAAGVGAGLASTGSFGNLQATYMELHAFTKAGGAGRSVANFGALQHANSSGSSLVAAYAASCGSHADRMPFLSKLESLAGSSVRAAGKVGADLIVVYTATGRTAQLVAKYRPPMPIVTLVVPRLVSDGIRWKLEGRSTARACQLTRGLLPMLATPGPNGDAVLEAAILAAAAAGLVAPRHHVVVLQQIHEDFCVKIMTLDKTGLHVAGSRLAPQERAASKTGSVSAGLYPLSPGMGRQDSTGALIDSDDGGEPEPEPPVAAAGSFMASASMLYSAEQAAAAARVTKAMPAGAQAAAKAPAALQQPAGEALAPGISPSTPARDSLLAE